MKRCKILRSLDRVFVSEFVLCIGAPSKDPARFVDLGLGIVEKQEAQEYKRVPKKQTTTKTVNALKPLAEAMDKLTADGTQPHKKAEGGTSDPNQHTTHCSSHSPLALVEDVHCSTSLIGPDARHY